MRIPAHLCLSRHGVYYFRETSTVAGKQRAKKISLHTKDPEQAKRKAIQLLSMLISNNDKEEAMSRFGKFEITTHPNGSVSYKTDKDDPNDIENLGRFLQQNPQFTPQRQTVVQAAPPVQEEEIKGEAFHIIIEKYTERYTKKWAKKTLYGYLQNINIFKDWAAEHFKNKDFSVTAINRKVIALYINHLRKKDINDNTIAKNYLIPLNGFFDFARSIGEYPDVEAPSRKHDLIDSKTKIEKPRNPFEVEELRTIFDPANLPRNKHPEQFWAPLIALFSGGRISEVCQLHRIDIGKREGFYTMSITDDGDGDKRLKSEASRRIIPINPVLIDIGFLDFCEDMAKFGGQLFPTVKPDIFGYYGKEPGRRWATYLDKIGITDPTKVFHSFRTTANVLMMDKGVDEERRCAFIGHEYSTGTVNSRRYRHKGNEQRGKFTPDFLFEHVMPAMKFDVDFSKLKYEKGMFDRFIYKTLREFERKEAHNEKREELGKKSSKSSA